MALPTEIQTLSGPDGNPAYVVIPYDVFVRDYARRNDLIPHEVVSATVDGSTPMKAWREHLRLTQAEVAGRIGVTQAGYAQIEASVRPRKSSIGRVAEALGISIDQLDF